MRGGNDFAVDAPTLQLPGPRRGTKRLNIGCGTRSEHGWVNADIVPAAADVVAADLTQRLPWSDGVFDCAVAHHVLQMIEYSQLVTSLAELRRVLRAGGVLRISVPSLLRAVRAHARGDADWFPAIVGDESTLDGRFCAYVTWYSTARSVFTPSWLVELCCRAGFESVTSAADFGYSPLGGDVDGICDLDDRGAESTWVEARR